MSSFATPSSKPDFWQLQQGIIHFWKQHHSFEQSMQQRSGNEAYRFYDGPPFITGTPHYGTLLSSILKDIIPRYHTMKGKLVERVWGRDCHGLPIEEKVQKKLGLNSSLDIENVGIQTFIDECYRYTTSTSAERSSYVDNIGRRVDFDNSYKTMDNNYMESVMRVFKQLRDKGLIYKGKRVSMYSTKLETPISSFEVAMDDTYGEINDPAITVMFRIDSPFANASIDTPTQGDILQDATLPAGYTLRFAHPDDFKASQTLHHIVWRETYPQQGYGITKEDIDRIYLNMDDIETRQKKRDDECKNNTILHIRYDNVLVGSSGPNRWNEELQGWEISTMNIHPDHQKKGLGRTLLDIRMQEFPGGISYVNTAPNNIKAIAFYQKAGFVASTKQLGGLSIKGTDKEIPSYILEYHKTNTSSLPEGYGIRLATPEDAEAIQSVRNRSWIQTYVDDARGVTAELIQARFDKNRERNINRTADQITQGEKIYVATYQGEIIGIKRDQYKQESHREYGGLYILADHHSRGLGRTLSDISLAGCGHMDLSLDVHAGNVRAISFYEKLGFERVAGSEKFHEISDGKGFDVITMIKKSPQPLYALARTTTPWTMPCNIALAVNQDALYRTVVCEGKNYIIAEARVESIFAGKQYEALGTPYHGSLLVGLSYIPPFEYLYGKTGNSNDHKIYHADFITDTDGTGIGHEAPEFGEVDFQLAKQVGLTITEAMNNDGTYSELMQDLSGHFYRDMNDELISRLRDIKCLFNKGMITHRVAFCPRSGVPLVYKAQDSRFIDIQQIKPRLLEHNEQINRYPEHLKHGRFAKSIESAPDRCISRTRYRGTPMPVYTSTEGTMQVIGSRDELFELNKPFAQLTKFILTRHGRTDYNDKKLVDHHNKARLTDLGKQQAQNLIEKLKDHHVDVIYSSPFDRCMETIRPYAEAVGLTIHTDDRLREFDHGDLQDKTFECNKLQRNEQKIGDGNESIIDIHERVRNVMHELITKHPGQTVMICSHQGIIQLAGKVVDEYDFNKAEQKLKRTINNKTLEDHRPKMAYVVGRTMKNLDLHRPTIDEILIQDPETKQTLHRIPEVLDCWMESASMPYGQVHYPFENKVKFDESFPADFVVEYTGQIRAWFYVMHVLGVALFDKPAFKNVLCTGVMAGNDGRKMSKSYGNFMDPRIAFEQYGGDAVRMAIMNTPVVYGGDMAVKDEVFVEAIKKTLLPVWNAYSFLVTYALIDQRTPSNLQKPEKSDHFLDQWMLAELDTLIVQIDTHIASYAVHKASESLIDFLDILTNRYIRRSRRRFWSSDQSADKTQAYETLYYVLVTVCQISAPLIPFISEHLWKHLTAPVFGLDPDQIRQDSRSVHLCDFPTVSSIATAKQEVSSMMNKVRSIVKAGLGWRARRVLRVRQPLASLTLSISLDQQYLDIIAEEVNIKHIMVDESLTDRVQSICKPNARLLGPKFGKQVQELIHQGKQGNFTNLTDGRVQIGDAVLEADEFEIDYVSTDTQFDGEVVDGLVLNFDPAISHELALEGYARDLIRLIQDARKEADYNLADRIQLSLDESLGLVEQFGEMIMEETLSTIVASLETPDITKTVELGGQMIGFGLKR